MQRLKYTALCSRVNKNQVHQISALAMRGHQLESLPWPSCCLEERAASLSCRSSSLPERGKLTPLMPIACHVSGQWELTPLKRKFTHNNIFFKTSHFLGQYLLRGAAHGVEMKTLEMKILILKILMSLLAQLDLLCVFSCE